jgi:hypothetical protein
MILLFLKNKNKYWIMYPENYMYLVFAEIYIELMLLSYITGIGA